MKTTRSKKLACVTMMIIAVLLIITDIILKFNLEIQSLNNTLSTLCISFVTFMLSDAIIEDIS